MSLKTWLFVGAFAAGAAAMSLVPSPAALAKAKPESFVCKFGKKTLKMNLKPSLTASYASLTNSLILTGSNLSGSGLKTRSGQFTLAGGVPNLHTATFPVTMNSVVAGYIVGGLGGGQGWTSSNDTVTVTITSYDNDSKRITGTFSGTMEPGNNTPAGTVTVTKGKFALYTLEN